MLDYKMSEAWKKLKEKDKRTKAGLKETQRRPKGEELTVQRLSAHVSGKGQKYCRMGPREFVPFPEKLEFNIENIKSACLKHFAPTIEDDIVCDILAGEQGPSCKSVNQIPDLKVIHVRFVPEATSAPDIAKKASIRKRKATASDAADIDVVDIDDWNSPRVSSTSHFQIKSSPNKIQKRTATGSVSAESKYIPKSLSISDMIKLGKVNKSTATTVVKLYQFDTEVLAWSKVSALWFTNISQISPNTFLASVYQERFYSIFSVH